MPDTRKPSRSYLTRSVALASWLIPPIFALAAALVHFQFHVPTSPMVPRDPDKKTKPKPKKPSKKPSKAADRKPGSGRELTELEQLRTRWSGSPIEDEPEDKDFRRQHESLLRGVVQVAREAGGVDERSAIVRVSPHCHIIRCTIEVCAEQPIIDAVATYLPQVESVEGPLWHEITETTPEGERPEAKPPNTAKSPPAAPRSCRAWLVGFVSDGVKRSELLVPGVTPARVENPARVDAPETSGDAEPKPESKLEPKPELEPVKAPKPSP